MKIFIRQFIKFIIISLIKGVQTKKEFGLEKRVTIGLEGHKILKLCEHIDILSDI